MKFICPECKTTEIVVTTESSYYVNTMELFCHSVKAHDYDARVGCLDCGWKGKLQKLLKMTEAQRKEEA